MDIEFTPLIIDIEQGKSTVVSVSAMLSSPPTDWYWDAADISITSDDLIATPSSIRAVRDVPFTIVVQVPSNLSVGEHRVSVYARSINSNAGYDGTIYVVVHKSKQGSSGSGLAVIAVPLVLLLIMVLFLGLSGGKKRRHH